METETFAPLDANTAHAWWEKFLDPERDDVRTQEEWAQAAHYAGTWGSCPTVVFGGARDEDGCPINEEVYALAMYFYRAVREKDPAKARLYFARIRNLLAPVGPAEQAE